MKSQHQKCIYIYIYILPLLRPNHIIHATTFICNFFIFTMIFESNFVFLTVINFGLCVPA